VLEERARRSKTSPLQMTSHLLSHPLPSPLPPTMMMMNMGRKKRKKRNGGLIGMGSPGKVLKMRMLKSPQRIFAC